MALSQPWESGPLWAVAQFLEGDAKLGCDSGRVCGGRLCVVLRIREMMAKCAKRRLEGSTWSFRYPS